MEATYKIVSKCMQLQGPWCYLNPQSERLDFLHLTKSSADVVEQAWGFYLSDQEAKDSDRKPEEQVAALC